MSKKPFKFKQFTLEQDKCAMKVGTDALLLGSWTTVEKHQNFILDIGAGTGILALMMAQRSEAPLIDALEIDDRAYEQCVANFENSPWNDRLFCYHASLETFTKEIDEQYDLIISNPPFYAGDYKSNDAQRNLARSESLLPFRHLIESASKLLAENGIFSVVIPYSEETNFIALAAKVRLYPKHILRVQGTPSSSVKRSCVEFSFQKSETLLDELIIETSRHQYTQDYINLTKDFYLKM